MNEKFFLNSILINIKEEGIIWNLGEVKKSKDILLSTKK